MKHLATISFIAGLLGCNQQPKTDSTLITNHVEKTEQNDSAQTTKKTDNSKYYTTKDTLIIAIITDDDTLKYGKDEFNLIVDNHPELYSEDPDEPDQLYNCNFNDFLSEAQRDSYYVLYAYFLKQKNGVDNNKVMRKKLIDIYRNINSLFASLNHGGTYFGHQYKRILGYAEYSVYLNPYFKNMNEKTYDITKQKELYIKSLRQLIDDVSKIDDELGEEKIARNKELNKIVDDLNKLIIDNFYLRRAQEFQYRHYGYY